MPKGKMTNDEIIQYFVECKQECEDETVEIRKTWDILLNQYMCNKDFSKKKNWQFKVYTPISKPVIKKATRIIKNIMLRAGEYFDFTTPSDDKMRKQLCDLTKRELKVHLNACKFVDQFATALESGFTLALMILKWYVTDEEDHYVIEADKNEETGDYAEEIVWNSKLKLKAKPINPFNFYFTRDRTVQIEDEWIKLPQLREMVDNDPKDDDGNSLYDQKTLKKIINGDYGVDTDLKDEDRARLDRIGILEAKNNFRKDVLISHFWGDLVDKKNKVYMKNCNFMVVNEKYILLKPRPNPYWHGKTPYVFDSPLKVLFREIGKGLTEDIMGIEDAIVDFVCLQMDNLMWQLLGINEVDELALTESSKGELRELYPGKLIKKRTGYQGEAFKFHELGVAPEKAMSMLQELKVFAENDHGVTEFVRALSGGSETATEYSGKKQSALSDFQTIAQDIESGFMVECLDRARDLMVQYLVGEEDEKVTAIYQEQKIDIASLNEAQRRQMIVTDIDFIARGISVFFERENLLNKLGAYVKFLNAMPDQAQLFPKWPEILKRINDAYAFDKPDELLFTEEQVNKIMQQRQQQAQQQMQMQMKMESQQRKEENAHEMAMLQAKLKVELIKILTGMKADYQGKAEDREFQMLQLMINDLNAGAQTGGNA